MFEINISETDTSLIDVTIICVCVCVFFIDLQVINICVIDSYIEQECGYLWLMKNAIDVLVNYAYSDMCVIVMWVQLYI